MRRIAWDELDENDLPNRSSVGYNSLQAALRRWRRWREKRAAAAQQRNMSGFTPDQVKQEASRIVLHSTFDSFDEFEYSLRCWAVEAQRSILMARSAPTHRVARCRYGAPIRKYRGREAVENNEDTESRNVRKKSSKGACGEAIRKECADGAINPCKWRVRAQLKKDTQTIVITVCNLVHTCPSHIHTWRAPSHNSKWLTKTLVKRVATHPEIRVKLAKDDIGSGEKESFHKIPAYCQTLKSVDGEAFVEWGVYPDTQTFRRIFISPSASRHAFGYLLPNICLHACHTTNKRYPMQVLLATALDGNNQIMFLAWAVTDKEDEENWTWFCEMLSKAIHGISCSHVSFVSDRQKGLVHAVHTIFSGHQHVHCTKHLEMNVKARYGVGIEKIFKRLHQAKTETRFQEILGHIETVNPDAHTYISGIEPHSYALYALRCPRFGQSSSNVLEDSANAAILEFRNFSPLRLLTELYKYVMESVAKRQRETLAGEGRLTAYAQEAQRKNEALVGDLRVYQASRSDCLVSSASSGDEFVVRCHLSVECECLEMRDMLWPCPHVMAWDRDMQRNSERLIDRIWTQDFLRLAYSRSLVPFSTRDLPVASSCAPPPRAVRRGRHRIRRIPSQGHQNTSRVHWEVVAFPAHDADEPEQEAMPRSKRQKHCGLCKQPGHNKKTCLRARRNGAQPSGALEGSHPTLALEAAQQAPEAALAIGAQPSAALEGSHPTLALEAAQQAPEAELATEAPEAAQEDYFVSPQVARLSQALSEAINVWEEFPESDAFSSDDEAFAEMEWHVQNAPQPSQISVITDL